MSFYKNRSVWLRSKTSKNNSLVFLTHWLGEKAKKTVLDGGNDDDSWNSNVSEGYSITSNSNNLNTNNYTKKIMENSHTIRNAGTGINPPMLSKTKAIHEALCIQQSEC